MEKQSDFFKFNAFNSSLFYLCPVLISIATIGVYQYLNEKFDICTMLIGIFLFSKLQEPLGGLPFTINSVVETVISLRRIEKFIRQPERNENNIIRGKYDIMGDYAIKIEHGNFTWGIKQKKNDNEDKDENKISKNEDKKITQDKQEEMKEINDSSLEVKDKLYDIVLEDITLTIKPGELVGIIGEVGSGKSSLFECILNSLILLNPNECKGIYVNGSIGYVSQNPWIQNDTIKNNILFFKKEDSFKYQEVLEQSQLLYDMSNLEGGDNTEIGEKGINLSGGQKVRISLARALYSNPDIYLLDDPISALDANIGKKIIKNCIINYLKGKTRIIITHAIHYLKHMDRIIYLHKGKIKWNGTYHELLQQAFFDSLNKLSNITKHNSIEIEANEEKITNKKNMVKITADEDEEIGKVKFEVYK